MTHSKIDLPIPVGISLSTIVTGIYFHDIVVMAPETPLYGLAAAGGLAWTMKKLENMRWMSAILFGLGWAIAAYAIFTLSIYGLDRLPYVGSEFKGIEASARISFVISAFAWCLRWIGMVMLAVSTIIWLRKVYGPKKAAARG